jgi:hypothetical protein
VQVALLAQFVVAWSLAMATARSRWSCALHAVHGAGIVDPIVARIAYTRSASTFLAAAITYGLVDAILLA